MTGIDENRMTLGEHCQELRSCLIRALIGIGVGVAVCLVFGDRIMALMCWPAAVAFEYRGLPIRLRTLAPAEPFMMYMKVCIISGLILAAPYSLRQIWRFVAAGLHAHERRHVQRYVPLSAVLFAMGVAFFFVVIAPICVSFFIGFGRANFPTPTLGNPILRTISRDEPATTTQTANPPATTTAPAQAPVLAADPADPADGQFWIHGPTGELHYAFGGRVRVVEGSDGGFITPAITLNNYITFVAWLSLVFGVGFQTPIAVLALAGTGLVSLQRMRTGRKYVVLALAFVAALLTPPDVVSQIALAAPMYLLFELGLLLAGRGRNQSNGK